MRLKITIALLILLFSTHANAQRILVGGTGSSGLGSDSIGILTTLELPLTPRLEPYLTNTLSPLLSHPGTGSGRLANQLEGGAIIWMNHTWGVIGGLENSYYRTSQIHKSSLYPSVGAIFRFYAFESPMRLNVVWIHQIANGIDKQGIETGRINGVRFGYQARVGTTGHVSWRVGFTTSVAHGLNQGNPQCDGTFFGPATCPRSDWTNGSVGLSFAAEFGVPRGREQEVF